MFHFCTPWKQWTISCMQYDIWYWPTINLTKFLNFLAPSICCISMKVIRYYSSDIQNIDELKCYIKNFPNIGSFMVNGSIFCHCYMFCLLIYNFFFTSTPNKYLPVQIIEALKKEEKYFPQTHQNTSLTSPWCL